jgi:hypothetical protein
LVVTLELSLLGQAGDNVFYCHTEALGTSRHRHATAWVLSDIAPAKDYCEFVRSKGNVCRDGSSQTLYLTATATQITHYHNTNEGGPNTRILPVIPHTRECYCIL